MSNLNAQTKEVFNTKNAISLSNQSLNDIFFPSSLSLGGIEIPKFYRSKLKTGIVHIGMGGFHRAHQAMYLNSILNKNLDKPESYNWGICGVGIMPQDEELSKILTKQDFLYSLTERSGKSDTCKIIGSVTNHILGLKDPEKVFNLIAEETTKIISLTVTEGGYYIDESTGELNLNNERVRNDILNPKSPITVFGFIAQGLIKRMNNGSNKITILCCDNIQHNGEVVKKALLRFTNEVSKELSAWIKDNVSFPNSMVDRITPVSKEAERNFVLNNFSINDGCPVVSESFTQWVIEDNFIAGRPPLEEVGVQFVKDVIPFERMKIRLLNASHSAMGYLGYLLGHRYIHEVAQSMEYRPYLLKFMDSEMTPLVGNVPGVDLNWYKATLIERFSNQDICDTVLRICSGGSAKIPGFILPSIQDAIEQNKSFSAMTLVVASWLRFLSGKDEEGNEIPLEDSQSERLREIAQRGKESVEPYLEMKDIFGSLSNNEAFKNELQRLLTYLYKNGAKETMKSIL